MTAKQDLDADKRYFSPDELATLALEQLETLWGSVPTEEQNQLTQAFEAEAGKRNIIEDAEEAQLASRLLAEYGRTGLVPAGDVFVKVPSHLRERYANQALGSGQDESESSDSATVPAKKVASKLPFPPWLLLLAIPFACLVIFAVGRAALSGGSADAASAGNRRPTARPTLTMTPSVTPSPRPTATPVPPTATPFALGNFDDTIERGDTQDQSYFPVQLQVFPGGDLGPRVFIVQEQSVELADWRYDPNPDVVSWLSGMQVRRVLGMPYSEANSELLQSLNDRSVLAVTMNTGETLQFVFKSRALVSRADTTLFQQNAPGLVIVLIGHKDANGFPTEQRFVIEATYPIDQEVSQLAARASALTPMNTLAQVGPLRLSALSAQLVTPPDLPTEVALALVDVQLVTQDTSVPLRQWRWYMETDSAPGERYLLDLGLLQGVALANCEALNDVSPNTSVCATLAFIVPRAARVGKLLVGPDDGQLAAFRLDLQAPPVQISTSDLQVQLDQVSYTANSLEVQARLFNPTSAAIPLTATDFGVVLGFVANPTGQALMARFDAQQIEAGQALDIRLSFPYAGEGFATLTLAGYVWGVTVR
jgi:hypothetical protein